MIVKEKMKTYYTLPEFHRLVEGENLMKRSMRSLHYDMKNNKIPTVSVMGIKKAIPKTWIVEMFFGGVEPKEVSMVQK